jgi:NADPH:quinone reductase-like Zn-dependent oxidoreductase
VRVKATALNIEDIMTAVGRRPLVSLAATSDQPVVLGQEFAGVVEEVGSKVTTLKAGDAVLGQKIPFRVR